MTSRTTPAGTQTLEFGAENRLDQVTDGDTTTSFTYDANGNRVLKIITDGPIQGGTTRSATVYVGGVYEHTVEYNNALIADPSFLSLSGTPTSGPITSHVAISTSNGTDTEYTASSDQPTWLSTDPQGFTAGPDLAIIANPAELGPGLYSGTITVSADGYEPVEIFVDLEVNYGLVVSPPSVSVHAAYGGYPSRNLSRSLPPQVPGDWSASTHNTPQWLTIDPSSVTTPGTFSFTANPDGLDPGTYETTVQFIAPAGYEPISVPVTFTVDEPSSGGIAEVQVADDYAYGSSVTASFPSAPKPVTC